MLVIWFEVGEFFSSLSSCKFPDKALRGPLSAGTSARSSTQPTHLVLVSDPHVPHPELSHESPYRWISYLEQKVEELFMRKSWNVIMRLGKVDGVVFLGDMLDWGRGQMTDQE